MATKTQTQPEPAYLVYDDDCPMPFPMTVQGLFWSMHARAAR